MKFDDDNHMDAIWIKTIRQLEMELAKYKRLRAAGLSCEDTTSMKASLDLRYSQFIEFTAGLSDADIDFDCDLDETVLTVQDDGSTQPVFGTSAVSSTPPYLSTEVVDLIERSHKAGESREKRREARQSMTQDGLDAHGQSDGVAARSLDLSRFGEEMPTGALPLLSDVMVSENVSEWRWLTVLPSIGKPAVDTVDSGWNGPDYEYLK
jgi:hypothetical protein